MSGETVFWFFVYVGLPFIAGLLGAWQAYRHKVRGEVIWKVFAFLSVVAFVGVALVSIALSPLGGYAFSQYQVPGWALLGTALSWFLLTLMVGSMCLYKAYRLKKQRNRKWVFYFAVGIPLTFIIPAIGIWTTLMLTGPVGHMCYVPMPENWQYSGVLSAGMLLKRKDLLTKIYKEKKINKEVYEKIKRTLE